MWFLGKDLHNLSITRDPVTFTDVNGTPYNGNTTDNEGIAVLPDGDFAISSEGIPPAGRNQAEHPTIRIFDANGRQKGSLRFRSCSTSTRPRVRRRITLRWKD